MPEEAKDTKEVKAVKEQKPLIENTAKNAQEEIQLIELAIKKAQLEDIELQKQERKFNLADLRARIDDRELKTLQKQNDREAQGRTFASQRAADAARQKACTHRKGGSVSPRDMSVLNTGGNSEQYAVIKHQMINGDIWVRCLRCGKTWSPPLEANFFFYANGKQAPSDGAQAGVFDKPKFDKAWDEYRLAVQFSTRNGMSASVQCKFTVYDPVSDKFVDASDIYRERLASTTLR